MPDFSAWRAAPNPPIIIYHSGCPDGTCAAAIALRALPGAETVPALYGDEPPDVADREVYIVDFSYSRDVLDDMAKRARSLTILDHHKSAAQALEGFPGATFDMDRSGAGLTWDHFNPGEDRPWVVAYVEDRDLWRFALPDSRAVNAYISTFPLNEPERPVWRGDGYHPLGQTVDRGRAILSYQRAYCERVAATSERGVIAGYSVPVVNAPYPLGSNVLELLDPGEKFAARWQRVDGRYAYSLRSASDGLDVSEIATGFGGGGHEHAAGFVADALVHLG